MSNMKFEFFYTNHKGQDSFRSVLPLRVHFGVSPWHPGLCWLLDTYDFHKNEGRTFPLGGIVTDAALKELARLRSALGSALSYFGKGETEQEVAAARLRFVQFLHHPESTPVPESAKTGRIKELEAECERLRQACATTEHYTQQIIGKALGYKPLYPEVSPVDDGQVCVGDHVAETLACEAARQIGKMKDALLRYEKWEGKLMNDSDAWNRDRLEFPKLTEELFDELQAIQANRNEALEPWKT